MIANNIKPRLLENYSNIWKNRTASQMKTE